MRNLPNYVIKNGSIYLSGITYYLVNNTHPISSTDYSLDTKRRVLLTFKQYMLCDRDRAIQYVLDRDYRIEIIRNFSDNDEYYKLLGCLITRKHDHGLFKIFNLSTTRPEGYFERFGSEIISYPASSPSFFLPMSRVCGHGNYGIVYIPPQEMLASCNNLPEKTTVDNVYKFTYDADAYICEFFSTLLLMNNKCSLNYQSNLIASDMIHLHLQILKPMCLLNHELVSERYPYFMDILTHLSEIVDILTDYSYMHLDINPNNMLWDKEHSEIRLIDFSGTLGDDSFYDLGQQCAKLCTRTTRPEVYDSPGTMYRRDEVTEKFCLSWAINRLVSGDVSVDKPPRNQLLPAWITDFIEGDDSSRGGERSCLSDLEKMDVYFSHWTDVFKDISHLPPQSVREQFRNEVLKLMIDPSHGELRYGSPPFTQPLAPIYILFRCIHLFDALYEKLSTITTLSIRTIALTLFYICLSLIKVTLKSVSYSEAHPLYQVLRIINDNKPEVVYLLFTPLTGFINYLYATSVNNHSWFKCLYSRIPGRRIFFDDREKTSYIIAFAHLYYQEVCDRVITDPSSLFEGFDVPHVPEGGEGGRDPRFETLVRDWFGVI